MVVLEKENPGERNWISQSQQQPKPVYFFYTLPSVKQVTR